MPDPAFHHDDDLPSLIVRFHDGLLTGAEFDTLESLLASSPDARRLFVTLAAQSHALAEVESSAPARPASAGRTQDTPPPLRLKPDLSTPRAKVRVPAVPHSKFVTRHSIFAAAALLLFAAAAVAIWLALFNRQSEIDNRQSPSTLVATILETSPGSTLVVNDTIVNSGDDIRSGDLSLDAGSADFRLTNGVAVSLRGPTHLTVHDAMSATLSRGSASFDCPPAAKGYAVHLPGGTRVVDLGTRFTVTAIDGLRPLVAVAQGSAEAHDASDAPLVLTADQAAVALIDPATGSIRFRRVDPMLRYDPAAAAVARSDGLFTIGSLIEVGDAPLWLTHLGAHDASPAGPSDDGFRAPEPIRAAIWDESGRNLLASVEVHGDAPLIGGWRYAAIGGGPVRLEPGARYRIGALVGAGVEWFLDAESASAFWASPGLRLVESCYHTGDFAAPMKPGLRAPGRWGAANALTAPIPSDSVESTTPAAERRAQETDNETGTPQETEP